MKTKILKIVSALMVAVMLLCASPVGSAEYNSTVISSLAAAKKIKLKKTKLTLITGESYTQKLLNEKGKTITKNVKWSTANKKTATVSSKGKVTAKKAGKVKITAKYKNKKYTFTVTVKNAVLSEKKKTLKEGKSFTLTLKGNGKKISTKNIKFKTSSKKIATVSSKGKVTAVAPGKATITATYKGKAYKCTVTVKGVYKLEFESKKLPSGTSFKQSLLDPDGKRVDDDKIMWNSDNTEVATVSSNGVVVGWKTGEATIYAIYKDEIYKSTVKVVNETAIVFSAEVTVGTIGLIQLRDKNGSIVSNSEIKWSSDDEKVIVVLPNGMAAARAEGTATITAEYKDKKYKHTVTVVKASDKGEATMSPSTTALVTAPVTMAPTTAPETTIASMKDYSASEIVEAYNKFINNAKRYTYPVAIHKTEVMNAKATEVPSALKSVIDRSISILTKPSEWSKTFVDGREVNGADRNLSEVLPPMSRDCSLEKSDVASAKVTATKNGYDIVIVLKEETEVFDGTSMTKEAVSHNKAVNLINLGTFDLPSKIDKAETTYSGATLEMSVDKLGRITKLRTFTPAESKINTKVVANIEATLEGSLEEVFEFSYDVNVQIPSTTGPAVAPIITAPATTVPVYTNPQTTSPAERPTNAPGTDLKKEIIGVWKSGPGYSKFNKDGSLEAIAMHVSITGTYTLKGDVLTIDMGKMGSSKGKIVIQGDTMFWYGEEGDSGTYTRASEAEFTTRPAGEPTMAPTYAPAITEAPTYSPSGSSASEAVAAYNKAVNDAKYYTGGVTLHMLSNASVSIADSAAKKIITPVVSSMTTPTDREWKFENGSDSDGRRLSEKLPPEQRESCLDESDVVSATATANSDGGYDIEIVLKEETAVFDGMSNTKDATSHHKVMDTINLGCYDLGPIIISSADLTYYGATLKATVDNQGRLTRLVITNPVDVEGTDKISGLVLSATAKVQTEDTYELTYN